MAERRVLVRGVSGRYRRSSKKETGRILNEFVEMTGYSRTYAAWLLNQQGRKVWVNRKLAVVGEVGIRSRRRRRRVSGEDVRRVLTRLWKLLDYLCGKRLVAALPETIEALERHGELKLTEELRQKLLSVSVLLGIRGSEGDIGNNLGFGFLSVLA
jgi:hypothetical protein